MHPLTQSGKTDFKARVLLVGERLDLRSLGAAELLAADPVTIAAGANGIAVLFRYGAVVLFNVAPLEETDLLRQLQPLVQQPYPSPETESLEIHIDPGTREGMTGNILTLADYAIERFQLVADILSKSTVLAMYEARARRSFDLVEPFAISLQKDSRSNSSGSELLQQIGVALLSEHNLVGRVEVIDKPEIIWEHPQPRTPLPAAGRRIRDPRAAPGPGKEAGAGIQHGAYRSGSAAEPRQSAAGMVRGDPDPGGNSFEPGANRHDDEARVESGPIIKAQSASEMTLTPRLACASGFDGRKSRLHSLARRASMVEHQHSTRLSVGHEVLACASGLNWPPEIERPDPQAARLRSL